MDVFVFVIAIVGIATFGSIVREIIKQSEKKSAQQMNADVDQRFQAMEDRIRTLERIVTDQKSQLRDKIDSLN
ncbi:hypothetical protein [Reinekea sp. G2M2-21]|uniref:hypothetical protein n=1 Tax=Reinekea sp. G2M2-21 TaxID=2788942 RepID=UPI0018AAD8CF|nr:hypothetical protein [Reinekea sp. G2M2-21]